MADNCIQLCKPGHLRATVWLIGCAAHLTVQGRVTTWVFQTVTASTCLARGQDNFNEPLLILSACDALGDRFEGLNRTAVETVQSGDVFGARAFPRSLSDFVLENNRPVR